MAITAQDVAKLRQRTGLGMMDCKKALNETNGDFEAAVEILRKKVKGKMDERTDREAAEGLIVAKADGNGGAAIVEVNAETDFVARNDGFIKAVDQIADIALAADEGDVPVNDAITKIIDDLRIEIQENISYHRGRKYAGGAVGFYVHHNSKAGAMVQCEGPAGEDLLIGICQHITAGVPYPVLAVDESGLPAEALEKERQRAIEEAQESGKPAEIAEKMAIGKVRKWVGEHTLLGQEYVKELGSKKTIADILPDGVTVKSFVRFAIGQ